MPSSAEVKSKARLSAFMEYATTGQIQYVAKEYSVFVTRLQRDGFEAMADGLVRRGYRVSYGYKPVGAKGLGRLYQYTVVVEEGDAPPVNWPAWLVKWLGR